MKDQFLRIVIVATFFVATVSQKSFTQDCNPILSGMSYALACVNDGTTTLTVNWEMGGPNPACNAPAGSWRIQVSLPTTTEYIVSNATSVVGPEFTWTLDGTTLNGLSNQPIPWLSSGTISITVNGDHDSTPPCALVLTNGNIQIIPDFLGGSQVSFSNQLADDNKSAALGVDLAGGLPVDLMFFKGEGAEQGNQLYWQTASELNNAGFEVQKSANGVDWKNINWVEGKGTTQSVNNYDLLDRDPFIGDNYYRLKQIDFDGQFEFSNIINIRNGISDIQIQVLPNPSPGDVLVTVMNPTKEKMEIVLYDSAGLLIWKSGVLKNLEMWKKEFNLEQKEAYFISVQVGKEMFTEKILIINKK